MYHVISIGITTLILYFLSLTFSINGFYSKALHRKIWNYLLAGAFLLAGLAGIFLALQVTYKWDIPCIKSILKWHVECGTGLAFTGIIHFLWHLSYFTGSSGIIEHPADDVKPVSGSAQQNKVNLFVTGFTSTSVQLLLIREVMNISGGYELITGTFLASWLIGSAAGSALARKPGLSDPKKLNALFGINILVAITLVLLLGRIYLSPGETPTFLLSMIYTLIVLLPFTFVSGYIFIRLITLSREQYEIHTGSSFSVETAGGIISGLIVSLLSYNILNTYQMILLICIFFLVYFFITFIFKERIKRLFVISLASAAALLILFTSPDRFFRGLLLRGIKVVSTNDTPYGNITRGEYGGEESLYYNHRLMRWHNDEIEREENVHYAMLQHENPSKVLVISGDITSTLPEIEKYGVKEVWFVERDPGLLKIESLRPSGNKLKAKIINNDAYRFMRETREKFDIILLVIPPPSTLLLNRFYTVDFFSEARKHLNQNGVMMCSPGAGENYFNRESSVLYSSVFNSMSAVFRNVLPVIGNKLYYIASDDSLSAGICKLVEKRAVKNTYVSSDFLSDDLISAKTEKFLKLVDRNAGMNSLETPVACFQFQVFSLSRSSAERIPSLILMTIVFLLPAFGIRRKNFLMFFSAGALAGFEIILLIILQSTAGNMYQVTGLIVAGFMTGLALGSGYELKPAGKQGIILSSGILILFYLAMAVVCRRVLVTEIKFPGMALMILITFLPSFCTGQIFRIMTGVTGITSASGIYSADLAGSALSFIAISAIAVPLMGVSASLILLAVLIFAGIIAGTIGDKP